MRIKTANIIKSPVATTQRVSASPSASGPEPSKETHEDRALTLHEKACAMKSSRTATVKEDRIFISGMYNDC